MVMPYSTLFQGPSSYTNRTRSVTHSEKLCGCFEVGLTYCIVILGTSFMQQQMPASKGALVASLALFGLTGLGLAVMGLASMGEDKDAVWVVVFGLVVLLGTILIAPLVFKGTEKQRKAHGKHLKKHDTEEETAPVHHNNGNGGDFLSGIGSIVVVIVLLVIGFWLVRGAWHIVNDRINPPNWTGFFYYDPNDLNKYWAQDGFATADDCRSWVNNQVSRDFDGQYDYECGKGCRYESSLTVQVCKETVD